MAPEEVEVFWHEHCVSRQQRETLNGHKGCVVWFTGLSGCGKSTIAHLVDNTLYSWGIHSFVLDGDNVRHGLSASPAMLSRHHGGPFSERFGLGFSAEDREENIRRVGAVAGLFCSAGVVALAAFISPYRCHRDAVRDGLPDGDFIEVHVHAPLEVCEARDPKGLYKKARAGNLKGFTGIDDPYEPPENPELVLDTQNEDAAALADKVVAYLVTGGKISPPA